MPERRTDMHRRPHPLTTSQAHGVGQQLGLLRHYAWVERADDRVWQAYPDTFTELSLASGGAKPLPPVDNTAHSSRFVLRPGGGKHEEIHQVP
jgi:hypothetical protein